MPDPLLTFQSFSDPALADEIAEILKEHNIDLSIVKSAPLLDKGFVDTTGNAEILIKIRPVDFLRANEVLAEFYKRQIENVAQDYYLFDFTNTELTEILARPDEWGYFDYQLAIKILNERGQQVVVENAEKLRERRNEELARQETASGTLLFFGYFFGIAGGFIGLCIGSHIAYSKKTIPDGQRVYTYDDNSRKHGVRIVGISILILLIGILRMLGPVLLGE